MVEDRMQNDSALTIDEDRFSTHFKATLLSVIGYAVLFFGLAALGSVTIPAAIMAGYTCDSAFNKAEGDK